MPHTLDAILDNTPLAFAIGILGVMAVLTFNALFCIWLERKEIGRAHV